MTNDFQLKLRRSLLQISYPVTKSLGSLEMPWAVEHLTSRNYRDIKAILQPGDVLLLQKGGELTNLFIPGFWSHAAMYTGGHSVTEAVGAGVRETDLIDAILPYSHVMVRRAVFATPEQRAAAAVWAKAQIGAEYDLFFNPSNDALYCSELIWLAFEKTMGETPFKLRKTLGIETVTPEDIARADGKWGTLYGTRAA